MKRFWDKVNKTETCWLWTAYRSPKGYGAFRLDGKIQAAHRLSYELCVGPIPDSLQIDHLCRNPSCVRPDHLEPVTHKENMRRGNHNQRQRNTTHCPKGHEYNESNTYIRNDGRSDRGCRKCRTHASTQYKRRQKELTK